MSKAMIWEQGSGEQEKRHQPSLVTAGWHVMCIRWSLLEVKTDILKDLQIESAQQVRDPTRPLGHGVTTAGNWTPQLKVGFKVVTVNDRKWELLVNLKHYLLYCIFNYIPLVWSSLEFSLCGRHRFALVNTRIQVLYICENVSHCGSV